MGRAPGRAGQHARAVHARAVQSWDEFIKESASSSASASASARSHLFPGSGIPRRIEEYKLKTFLQIASPAKAQAAAVVAAMGKPPFETPGARGTPKNSLLIFGSPGSGKTGLLTPLFRQVVSAGLSGLWVSQASVFSDIRAGYDGDGMTAERMRTLSTVDVLFWDDLEAPTGSDQQNKIALIFRERNAGNLRTFITTRMTPTQMQGALGMALYEVVGEMCAFLHLPEESMREIG